MIAKKYRPTVDLLIQVFAFLLWPLTLLGLFKVEISGQYLESCLLIGLIFLLLMVIIPYFITQKQREEVVNLKMRAQILIDEMQSKII